MALSAEERQQFLAEPHIAALSVSAGPDRAPLTVPIWYDYRPGGEAWITTGPNSKKTQLIKAAGRFSLMAHRLEPTVRYVTVEGPVDRIVPGDDELRRAMAQRYLPEEKVDGFLEYSKANYGEDCVIYLRPERWLSTDLGTL